MDNLNVEEVVFRWRWCCWLEDLLLALRLPAYCNQAATLPWIRFRALASTSLLFCSVTSPYNWTCYPLLSTKLTAESRASLLPILSALKRTLFFLWIRAFKLSEKTFPGLFPTIHEHQLQRPNSKDDHATQNLDSRTVQRNDGIFGNDRSVWSQSSSRKISRMMRWLAMVVHLMCRSRSSVRDNGQGCGEAKQISYPERLSFTDAKM